MESGRVLVAGAGAAGLMAAARAAEFGARVTLLEKMPQPGRKLLISGKTRCNLTNSRELEEFLPAFGKNGRFLYSAFHRFFRPDLLALMQRYGVETATERGGRIFPASGNASDVLAALVRYATEQGVEIRTTTAVRGVRVTGRRASGLRTDADTLPADAVILAMGGASFPATGSAGDGYRIAADLGHTVTKLRPALVPLIVREVKLAQSMQGVSLRNVRLTSYGCPADAIPASPAPDRDYGRGAAGRRLPSPMIESRLGEMMLTHFGIGGPVTLLMSLAIVEALEEGPVSVAIDLKPGLTLDQLQKRLQRDFDSFSRRGFRNILEELLPGKMVDPVVEMIGILPGKPGHQITGPERDRLARLLKSLRFNIERPLPLTSAMVTAGGVALDQVDPRTMESKLVHGLYFCGEILDVDADTGGYNLQAAFSTGWVAGESAALGLAGH